MIGSVSFPVFHLDAAADNDEGVNPHQ
ncbi:MAG: hypothetical protein ACJATN_001855, partial [Neolewinella sp.]